jgi:hypothetical protein
MIQILKIKVTKIVPTMDALNNKLKLGSLFMTLLFINCSSPNDYYIKEEGIILTSKSNRIIQGINISNDSLAVYYKIIPKQNHSSIAIFEIDTLNYDVLNIKTHIKENLKIEPNVIYHIECSPSGDRVNNEILLRINEKGEITYLSNGFVEE